MAKNLLLILLLLVSFYTKINAATQLSDQFNKLQIIHHELQFETKSSNLVIEHHRYAIGKLLGRLLIKPEQAVTDFEKKVAQNESYRHLHFEDSLRIVTEALNRGEAGYAIAFMELVFLNSFADLKQNDSEPYLLYPSLERFEKDINDWELFIEAIYWPFLSTYGTTFKHSYDQIQLVIAKMVGSHEVARQRPKKHDLNIACHLGAVALAVKIFPGVGEHMEFAIESIWSNHEKHENLIGQGPDSVPPYSPAPKTSCPFASIH